MTPIFYFSKKQFFKIFELKSGIFKIEKFSDLEFKTLGEVIKFIETLEK